MDEREWVERMGMRRVMTRKTFAIGDWLCAIVSDQSQVQAQDEYRTLGESLLRSRFVGGDILH